jgi:hypothetical protein
MHVVPCALSHIYGLYANVARLAGLIHLNLGLNELCRMILLHLLNGELLMVLNGYCWTVNVPRVPTNASNPDFVA